MNSQLPEDIWSPSDLTELIADLHHYAEWLSSYSVKQRVAGQAVMMTPPPLSARAVASLQQLQEKQALTVAGVEALITDLQQFQSRAQVVTFTLAGPPSHGFQKRVVAWCHQTLSPDVLVSFQFNATILGGVVVRYGSHIFDWSYRRQILANRGKFAEILRSV